MEKVTLSASRFLNENCQQHCESNSFSSSMDDSARSQDSRSLTLHCSFVDSSLMLETTTLIHRGDGRTGCRLVGTEAAHFFDRNTDT
ncbi:hypothetical protein ACHAXN_010761 [Cyclotella atomus]